MSAKHQLLAQYDLHTLAFNNVIADISEEESVVRVAPHVNHVKWLAGHLVWGQGGLARLGGIKMDIPWLDHYNTQIAKLPSEEETPVPLIAEIQHAWNQYAGLIREGLGKIPDTELKRAVEFPMPQFATQEGFWAFINHHQAYTIGQIGILRRWLGKPAMKYF